MEDFARCSRKKGMLFIKITAVLLMILFLVSFCFGRYSISLGQVIEILLSRIGIPFESLDDTMVTVVTKIRLPRILLAYLVGCALASSGCAYQGVFQNPMASPDILGASSGAAFGAALSILLGLGGTMTIVFAFVFSLLTVLITFIIGNRAPGKRVVNLVLSGIIVGGFFTAGTSYIKLVADPSNQLPAITYWLMGSLSGAHMSDVLFAVIPMLLGIVPLFLLRWRINILTLGDEEAHAIGINVNRLRLIVVICATLLTATSVAVSGVIGWVGLIIPHLCRRTVGNDNRLLLPASALLGAFFLLLVDNLSRNLLVTEIPIGILTTFIGAPFFIYLIMRKGTTA